MTQNLLDFSLNPSGVELMDDYLAGMYENQLTSHSGVSRPSYARSGTFWIDTSTTPWVLKEFNGTNDVTIGTLDQTNLYFTAQRALGDKNGNDITSTYVKTTGTAAKATADADGNTISSTYVKTTGTAAKATADADGNTISSTYGKISNNNTWTGTNTFNDYVYINKEVIRGKMDAVLGTTPSSDKIFFYGIYDSQGTWTGGFERHYLTDGSIRTQMATRKQDGSSDYAILGVGYTENQEEEVIATPGVQKALAHFSVPNYSLANSTNLGSRTPDYLYTPTQDGTLHFEVRGTHPDAYIVHVASGLILTRVQNSDNSSGNSAIVWVPVRKGETYKLGGGAGGSPSYWAFFCPLGN